MSQVGSSLEQIGDDLLSEGRRCLEGSEMALQDVLTTIESRTKELDRLEAGLIDRADRLARVEHELLAQGRTLASRAGDLNAAKLRQSRQNEAVNDVINRQRTRVRLDVGGTTFVTSRRTLIDRDRKSLLAAMFDDVTGGESLKPEVDGSYFVDRDGVYFRYIMDWLRQGNDAQLPDDVPTLRNVLCEAKHYRLRHLVKRLENKLTELNASII